MPDHKTIFLSQLRPREENSWVSSFSWSCVKGSSLCSGFASSFLLWWGGLKSCCGWASPLFVSLAGFHGQLRGTWVVISQVQSLCMCSPLLSVYLQLEHCMRNVRVDPMASLSPKIPDHFFSSELALFINFLKMLFLWSWGKRMGQPEFSLNSLIFKEFFWLWFYHLVSFLVVS